MLSDQQLLPKEKTTFKHFALRMISASGVEDYSSLSIVIDPDYQTLTWHRLDIIRDGERIDQLPTQTFRASTNQGSDHLVYDNTLECVAIIQGTRKGDIIDYAYSITGGNPITGERFSTWLSLNYSVPIAHISARIVREIDDRPLNIKLISPDRAGIEIPKPIRKDTQIEYRFEFRDVAPLHLDDNVPNTYVPFNYFQITDWESWEEVGEWGRALYDYESPVSLPSDLERKLAEWQSLKDQKEQALAALDWVQEEIRYVGISIGPHNYKPYQITQTLQRSFGDCKDKTQLLCYLLKQMGITAYPTLVHTSDRELIGSYLPTPSNFNHVITTVKIDNQTYWIDPTNSSQAGPIETLPFPNYAYGLDLINGSKQLTELPGQGAETSKTFIRETFEVEGYDTEIQLTVYTRYSGDEADSQRSYFRRSNLDETQKEYVNFYAQQFPDIVVNQPLQIDDDTKRNHIEVTESYTISNGWVADEDDSSTSYLHTYPELLRSWTFLSDTRIRTMPAYQSHPLDFTQVIEVILPESGDFEKEDYQIDTPWFQFRQRVDSKDEKLITRYSYKTLTPSVPAEDYPEYAKKVDDLLNLLGFSIRHQDSDAVNESSMTDYGDSRPYLASYLSTLLAIVLGLQITLWIVTRKQTPPKSPVNPDLDGISGWLILPAIGIVALPFIYIAAIADMADYFKTTGIQAEFAKHCRRGLIPNAIPSSIGFTNKLEGCALSQP